MKQKLDNKNYVKYEQVLCSASKSGQLTEMKKTGKVTAQTELFFSKMNDSAKEQAKNVTIDKVYIWKPVEKKVEPKSNSRKKEEKNETSVG